MSQVTLMKDRRFWPLFWTQFLGAFNDNFFKNALVILIAYRAMGLGDLSADQMVALCGGIFILPFFLFSTIAGQLADKFSKSMLLPWIKALEIGVMGLAAIGFLTNQLALLLVVLFLMGAQSAFFGPVKYGILPELITKEELTVGNALVNTGTFLAILLGTLAGGLLIAIESTGALLVALGVIVIAVLGYLTSRFTKKLPAGMPALSIKLNPIGPIRDMSRAACRTRSVLLSMLGVAWFWFFGASMLALFPTYCKDVLYANEQVVTFFLGLFSVGIAVGSLLCGRLSRGTVELGLVPLGSFGMSLFAFDLYWVGAPEQLALGNELVGVSVFLSSFEGLRITADLLLLSIFCGFYIVPMTTLIQKRSEPSHRARVIAGSNILNSFLMVLSSISLIGLHALHLPIPTIFLIIGLMNLAVAVHIYFLLPEFLYRFLGWGLSHMLYRPRIRGFENLITDEAAVIVCNHVSFLDWLIVGGTVPRPVRFVMHAKFQRLPLVRGIFQQGHVIPIAGGKEAPQLLKKAFKRIAEELEAGEIVCIFPEGRLTRDGEIQKFHAGIERIIERSPVPVIPLAIRGMWGSLFCRCKASERRWSWPWSAKRLELAVGESIPPEQVTAAHLQQVVSDLRGDEK